MSSKCATKLSWTTAAVQCLVILSFHIAWCTAAARKDVENITLLNQPGVVGIWRWNDKNKYYPLSDFRNESARNYYDVWPEDIHDYSFQFPCEDRKSRLMLSNFTYAMNEGLVESLQYYDLGIVYRYRPYWRRPTTTCFGCTERLVGFPVIYCESGDLSALYLSRARKTLIQGLEFGAVMVTILESMFAVIGFFVPVLLLNRGRGPKVVIAIIADLLQCFDWGKTFVEWLHLMTLAVAGYTLIEGYGHSNTHHWRAWAMNTLAYYYRVQTACAFVSSFLRQCANSRRLMIIVGGTQNQAKTPSDKHREMLVGQVVVCVVMVEYLYVTDQNYLDFLIQVVFAVIAVAATVSMTIVISVGCKALHYLLIPVWDTLVVYGKQSPRVLIHSWRKLEKWVTTILEGGEEISWMGIELPTTPLRFGYLSTLIW